MRAAMPSSRQFRPNSNRASRVSAESGSILPSSIRTSALAAATRHLFGNPDPVAGVHAWPMQHPEQATLLWSAALLVVFAPLAVHLCRRKSLG
jgi:hypothetical protein